jgi:hypothetical protein
MDNSPVISMTFRSPVPGADRDVWDRFNNWSREAYTPLTLKHAGRIGCDFYQIVRESPQYPLTGYVLYTENIIAVEKSLETAEHKAIQDELNNWSQRGIVEFIWRVRYALLKSLKSTPDYPPRDRATTPKTAITHLEAYSLTEEEAALYGKWLQEYGFGVFFPLFLRLPGITGMDCFRCLDVKGSGNARVTKYPQYLSLMSFDKIEAFENYTRSAELAASQKAMRNIFPYGLDYRWYVQYELVKSWRK